MNSLIKNFGLITLQRACHTINKFITQKSMNKNEFKAKTVPHFNEMNYTDTFASSHLDPPQNRPVDMVVFKAVQSNNLEMLVEAEPNQDNIEKADNFNQDQQIHQIIDHVRKQLDKTKYQANSVEKSIEVIQKQKDILQAVKDKISENIASINEKCRMIEENQEKSNQSLEGVDYSKAIRLNMEQNLKQDILHYKSVCFQKNIQLIRHQTKLKQLRQSAINKKHVNFKSKTLLESLQTTVLMRQQSRTLILNEVNESITQRNENEEHKKQIEKKLEQSKIKYLQEKLPEEKELANVLYAHQVLKKILKTKMEGEVCKNSDIQNAYLHIKKNTRIQKVQDFVYAYMNREKTFGDLAQRVSKIQFQIESEKQIKHKLLEEQAILFEQSEKYKTHDSFFAIASNSKDNSQEKKAIDNYNKQLLKIEQLSINMRQWAIKTLQIFLNFNHKSKNTESLHQECKHLTTVQLMSKTLKTLSDNVEELDNPEVRLNEIIQNPEFEGVKTLMKKDGFKNINENVLNKDISRRNFRIKTQTTHQEIIEEKNLEYEDNSEYDFLKYNRRLIKKQNQSTKNIKLRVRSKVS